jgi:hypothetical protein
LSERSSSPSPSAAQRVALLLIVVSSFAGVWLPPLLTVSNTNLRPNQVVLGAVAMGWLLRRSARWRVAIVPDAWAALLLVAAFLAHSVVFSDPFWPGFAQAVLLALNVATFVVVYALIRNNPVLVDWTLLWVGICTIAAALWTLVLAVGVRAGWNFGWNMERFVFLEWLAVVREDGEVTAALVPRLWNATIGGSLFAALAVSALVLALSEQRRRTFWLLAGVAALTGVVTSAARGPLVAVAVGTVVFAALNVTKPLRLLGFLTIFLIGALALRFTMTLNDSTRAVLSMVEGKALSLVDARDYRRGTVAGRLSFWREMWRDFQENPFVGHGALAYKRYSVEDVVSENFPLEVLHSAGLAGGVALMGCFGGPILRGWRWSRRGAPEDRRVIVALLAGFCGLLVASLTNPVGWAALFWVLLALLASAAKIAQRHGRSVSPGRDAPLPA